MIKNLDKKLFSNQFFIFFILLLGLQVDLIL